MLSNEIYKRDSLGNVRVWQYEVDGNSWRTIAGLRDGQRVTSGWTICTPKSQPTAEAQAEFEAAAEMQKKLERDYHRSIDDIDTPNYFKPMLAQTYGGGYPWKGSVVCQPKLDGIRCIATAKGLFSRQGKRILGVPHIEDQLADFFDQNPQTILDGELYNHDLRDDFNSITSIVRKAKPSAIDLAYSETMIQYHVYDVPSQPGSYLNRRGFLDFDKPSLRMVPLCIAYNEDDIQSLYEHWIGFGYEGQMIRTDGPYEQKRSRTLLKHKSFVDDEFTLVDIQEGLGNWAGYGKKIVCQLPDGREFGAGVKGDQKFTKDLLDRRELFIGGQVTVRYFALTPDGVPRFPVAVDFHQGKRAD